MTRFSFLLTLALMGYVVAFGATIAQDGFWPSEAASGRSFRAAFDLYAQSLQLCIIAGAAFAAFATGSRMARITGWCALACVALLALFAVEPYLHSPPTGEGVGWVLYPPLSTTVDASLFAPGEPGQSLLGWKLTQQAMADLLALGFALLAAALIIEQDHPAPRFLQGAMALTVVGFTGLIWTVLNQRFIGQNLGIIVVLIPALAILTIGLRSAHLRSRPAQHYALYAVFIVVLGYLVAAVWDIATTNRSLSLGAGETYYIVNGFNLMTRMVGVFVWFAGLWMWLRPALNTRFALVHGGMMLVTAVFATAPVWWFSVTAPRRYIDYPEAAALLGLVSTIGTVAFLLIVGGGMLAIIARRAR